MTDKTQDDNKTYWQSICSEKIKRAVGYLFTHTVLMGISYHAAELCGSVGNAVAGIWLALMASFFGLIGLVFLIEAFMAVFSGGERDCKARRRETDTGIS